MPRARAAGVAEAVSEFHQTTVDQNHHGFDLLRLDTGGNLDLGLAAGYILSAVRARVALQASACIVQHRLWADGDSTGLCDGPREVTCDFISPKLFWRMIADVWGVYRSSAPEQALAFHPSQA